MNLFKKHYISIAILSASSMLLLGSASADTGNMPSAKSHEQHINIVHMVEVRLQNLKSKLNLESSQNDAWNAWSTEVISDVKKQHEEDQKLARDWTDNVSDNVSTPDKLAHQEEHLRHHIARMQNQLLCIEAARKNTTTFYAVLNKNQQTIFDLFWQEDTFHHHPASQ